MDTSKFFCVKKCEGSVIMFKTSRPYENYVGQGDLFSFITICIGMHMYTPGFHLTQQSLSSRLTSILVLLMKYELCHQARMTA